MLSSGQLSLLSAFLALCAVESADSPRSLAPHEVKQVLGFGQDDRGGGEAEEVKEVRLSCVQRLYAVDADKANSSRE
jgi:hypothetical protein